jgi:MFS transporter, ACS family, solute carrier family 17 (sodium-dependent inorganic phosphate cotransporter), other
MSENSALVEGPNRWQPRYGMVLACAFAIFIAYADRVNISVAALAMQQNLGWSEYQKGIVLASYFVGYFFTQIVGGWLSHRYGGERVVLGALVLWSACTLLTPVFAHMSFALLLMIRIGLGVGEGPLNPAVFNLFARFVPPHEHARAIAVFAGSGHAGTVVALVSTGFMVMWLGWESSFYLFGIIGLLYSVFLPPLLRGVPAVNGPSPQAVAGRRLADPIPWAVLVRQGSFLALAFSFFCACWVFYVLLLWMPSYFSREHGMNIGVAGIYSLSPWLTLIVSQNVSGWCSDTLVRRGLGATVIRKVFVVTGLVGAAVVLWTVPAADTAVEALLRLCAAMAFLASSFTGQLPNVFDIAPKYAEVLFSILNTIGTLPGLVGVALTGWLVDVTHSYDSTLMLASGLSMAGGFVYLLFGSGRRAV